MTDGQALSRRCPVGAGGRQAGAAGESGRSSTFVPGLRSGGKRLATRLRGGSRPRTAGDHRGAAGRCGGAQGRPFCRPSGKVAGSGAGRSRHRSAYGVGHQHRSALQIHPVRAREAAHPSDPRRVRSGRLQALAGGSAESFAPRTGHPAGRNGSEVTARRRFSGHAAARNAHPRAARKRRPADRDHPSVSRFCEATSRNVRRCSTDWSPTCVSPQVPWVLNRGESSHRPNPRDGWGCSRLAFSGRAQLERTEHQTSNVRCVRCRLSRTAQYVRNDTASEALLIAPTGSSYRPNHCPKHHMPRTA